MSRSTCAFALEGQKKVRVHQVVPRRGHITLFNRSHYEDVLAARVLNLVPRRTWRARYEHINAFERQLEDNNTILLKFYLHISREEQYERLLECEKDPLSAWKLTRTTGATYACGTR